MKKEGIMKWQKKQDYIGTSSILFGYLYLHSFTQYKFKNYKKNEQRAFWRSQFESGAAHPTEEQLNKMNKDEVDAFVYAYNETASEDEQISRYGTQKKQVTLDNGEKVDLTYARGEGGNAIRPLENKAPDNLKYY